MRQISDERIEHLSCEAVTQPWLRVSGDQVRAIIDRLRAAEVERDAWKVRFEELNRCAEQMSRTIWSLEAESDAYKAKLEQARELLLEADDMSWGADSLSEYFKRFRTLLAEPQPGVTQGAPETTPDSPSLPADRSGQPS